MNETFLLCCGYILITCVVVFIVAIVVGVLRELFW